MREGIARAVWSPKNWKAIHLSPKALPMNSRPDMVKSFDEKMKPTRPKSSSPVVGLAAKVLMSYKAGLAALSTWGSLGSARPQKRAVRSTHLSINADWGRRGLW